MPDLTGHILRNIAKMFPIACKHLDGIFIEFIIRLRNQHTDTLSYVVPNILTIRDACNIERQVVASTPALWPDADIIP
jgi:hypothetical protein